VSLGRIADYTLTRELGQGGMGKVYLAVSSEGTDVALKTMLLPEGIDARARWETVERFQREARAVSGASTTWNSMTDLPAMTSSPGVSSTGWSVEVTGIRRPSRSTLDPFVLPRSR
jgi:serine/threonine protein kinase